MSVRADKNTFETEVLQSDKKVIADFYSDSCVPCKRISPVLSEIEEENDDIKLVKININFDGELAEEYGVSSAPTLIFFSNGEEKNRSTGFKRKEEILDIVKNI